MSMPTGNLRGTNFDARSMNGSSALERTMRRSTSLPGTASPRATDPKRMTRKISGCLITNAVTYCMSASRTPALSKYVIFTELNDGFCILNRLAGLAGSIEVARHAFRDRIGVARRYVVLVKDLRLF